jgi:hypothetical protein
MAYNYVVNNEQGLAVLFCSRDFGLNELRDSLGELERQPKFAGIDKVVTDLAQGACLQLSCDEIERQARLISVTLKKKPFKLAFVASQDLTFGLFRVFAAYTEHDQVNVFRNMREACDWLRVKELAV